MDVSRQMLKRVFGEDKVENHFDEIITYLMEHPDEYRQKVLSYYSSCKNENHELCKECGGKCCKFNPCHFSPKDFEKISFEYLKKLLKKKKYISVVRMRGDICEDFLEGFEARRKYFYILRIRTSETGIAAATGEINADDYCRLLGPKGCKLAYEDRPFGAKMLIPKPGGNCQQLYGMEEATSEWSKKEYQDALEELYNYFRRIENIKRKLHVRL